MAKIRGYRTIPMEMKKRGTVAVRASAKTADALEEVSSNLTLYQGVRLAQVVEAVYEQGRKDGAREVIDGFDQLAQTIPHRTPGRPRRR